MHAAPPPVWTLPQNELLRTLASTLSGLSTAQAAARRQNAGPNVLQPDERFGGLRLFVRQFKNPLVFILLGGAALSMLLQRVVDAGIIASIVLGSALLGFTQEWRASHALAALRARLTLNVTARRDERTLSLPASDLVPGDIVLLSAGRRVPADGRVLEAIDCFVEQASLTGESFPVNKHPGTVAAETTLAERHNMVWAGTSVRSGTATVLITATGTATALGQVSSRLRLPEPETSFQRGLRDFGAMLLHLMVVMVIGVLAMNHWLGRPAIESLLFAVALAVGLSPELLPAIVSVTLAQGARTMAAHGALVRRLESIENLGGITVLCTDKTGTLTEGQIALERAVDSQGQPSTKVLRAAWINATLQTGIDNPLDAAIVTAMQATAAPDNDASHAINVPPPNKVAEIPYDFNRRRLTVVVAAPDTPNSHQLISKGAAAPLLECCDHEMRAGQTLPLNASQRALLNQWCAQRGAEGLRVLAVAGALRPACATWTHKDEAGLTLYGFLLFSDPPRADAAHTIAELSAMGVSTKIVTGDHRAVAQYLARSVGLDPDALLTGQAIAGLDDLALQHRVRHTAMFVEVDPQQKERIVRALQRDGQVVGYLGDGINDAPALRSADVGLSVDGAVDIARESADIVLLKPQLSLLREAIVHGRRTFANTMKYIAITSSANFGNMLSMAIAVPWLPFFPLTAKQILLNNFLSDLPALALIHDRVDAPQLDHPQRWHKAQVRRFMVVFGLISTAFDGLTFALLLKVFKADESHFQTAWFVVSLLTEISVVLVLRTHAGLWRSTPSPLLMRTTLAVAAITLLLPHWPAAAALFGFAPLSAPLILSLIAVVLGYILSTEGAKHGFWRANTAP